MERNQVTTMYQLAIGDRFYKAGDKNKTVYEKIGHEAKRTKFQTYSQFAIEAKYLSRVLSEEMLESILKAFRGDTEVIFLRHKEPAFL